ncbi:MAG: glycoside hydrolase family 3 C-terminal domain-containing protein, partial [Bifidobacteriaceae bacterium]|nr:glycoside hydrolase family 3 C-terminal domain-containing protein [Bifidobacteriaceae bacterium]
MKRVAIGLASAGLCLGIMPTLLASSATATGATVYPYQNTSLSPQVRAADLVSRMTLPEKQAQLAASNPNFGGQAPAIPRLGVKAYSYWNEALHGVARDGGTAPTSTDTATQALIGIATELPTGLGIASSWDTPLVQQEMTVVSDEARAYWSDPINGNRRYGLTFWSPTVNMDRDPRWGRAEETYGEDPYLTGRTGGAFTTGLQVGSQDDVDANTNGYLKAVATPKHFFANNSEVNRHTGSSNMTMEEMREYYTNQFRTIVKQYGAKSLMTAYSAVNVVPDQTSAEGIPMPADHFSDTTLLRQTWGFTGFVTSDCGAVENVNGTGSSGHNWAPAQLGRQITAVEATAWSLKAGTDVDCTGGNYINDTIPAIQAGLISENELNINLTRAFTVRFETGEFDPTTPWDSYRLTNQIDTKEHRQIAKEASEEAPVLLQNDGVLPLSKTADTKVAMVGEFSDAIEHGDYSPTYVPTDLSTLTPYKAMSTYSLGSGTPTVTKDDGVVLASVPSVGGLVFYDAQGNKIGDTFQFSANASAITDLVGYAAPSIRYSRDLGMVDSSQTSLTASFTANVAVPAGTAKIALLSGGTPTAPADGSATGFSVTINGAAATSDLIPADGPGTLNYWTLPTSEGASVALTAPTGVTFDGTTVVPLHFNYVNSAVVGVQVGVAGSQIDADIDAADVVLVQVGTKSSDAGEENDPSTVAL